MVEFLLVIATIFVICEIYNINEILMIMMSIVFVEIIMITMALMFAYCCVRLLFTKKISSTFSRIDYPPKGKFKTAFYKIDGIEYPCIFPSEMAMTSKMYKKGKSYTVMFSKSMKKVYDIYTVITCILGLLFSWGAVFISIFFFTAIFEL